MLLIDDRECVQHPEIPQLLAPLEVKVERLDAADYCFLNRDNEPVGIERSEINNLIQKVRSGELEEQLLKCQDNYSSVILLIEGVYDKVDEFLAVHKVSDRGYFRVRIYPNTLYKYAKALEVRLSELGIEILHSPNFPCSMELVKVIYNQRTKKEEEHTLFKKTRVIKIPTKWSTNPAVPRLMALVPRMSETLAIRLINQYGSIWQILNTDEKELLEIEGMGKTLIKRLRENVGYGK